MCGIYKYENLINHMVYIGQAIDLEKRHKKHLTNIYDEQHQEDIYKAFREFGINNFSYEILEQFEDFDLEKINNLECYYINKFNSLKPNGYNMVPGGTNGAGLAKGKAVEWYDIYGKYIKTFDSAHQAEYYTKINYSSICACCREDIQHTKGYQWKYVDSNKNIQDISKNGIIIRERQVYQYNLQGDLIYKYQTLKEASEKTGVSKSAICNVCNNKANTAGDFVWRYENEPFEREKHKKYQSKTKPVEQYDKQLNLLNIYDSIAEAAKQTNTNAANIQSVCIGRRKTANGYIWKYKI